MTAQEERRTSGVTITNREIYDLLLETNQVLREVVSRVTVIETRDTDHESRIRALERWRWEIGGVIALVAWAGAAAVSALWG